MVALPVPSPILAPITTAASSSSATVYSSSFCHSLFVKVYKYALSPDLITRILNSPAVFKAAFVANPAPFESAA